MKLSIPSPLQALYGAAACGARPRVLGEAAGGTEQAAGGVRQGVTAERGPGRQDQRRVVWSPALKLSQSSSWGEIGKDGDSAVHPPNVALGKSFYQLGYFRDGDVGAGEGRMGRICRGACGM